MYPQDTTQRKTLEKRLIFSLKTLYPSGFNKKFIYLQQTVSHSPFFDPSYLGYVKSHLAFRGNWWEAKEDVETQIVLILTETTADQNKH